MPDRHTWSANVAALSLDGWLLNEDAVVMQSQRLVTSIPTDKVEQCRCAIMASAHHHAIIVMVALCNRTDHYIFILWFLSSIYLFLFLT